MLELIDLDMSGYTRR